LSGAGLVCCGSWPYLKAKVCCSSKMCWPFGRQYIKPGNRGKKLLKQGESIRPFQSSCLCRRNLRHAVELCKVRCNRDLIQQRAASKVNIRWNTCVESKSRLRSPNNLFSFLSRPHVPPRNLLRATRRFGKSTYTATIGGWKEPGSEMC